MLLRNQPDLKFLENKSQKPKEKILCRITQIFSAVCSNIWNLRGGSPNESRFTFVLNHGYGI